MTYTVVPDKASGDIFTEQMWDTYVRDNANKGVIRPIADTTLGSAAQITFSSIAADWLHLLLVVYSRGQATVTSADLRIRFNGDTGTNYDIQQLQGVGAVTTAAEAVAATSGLGGVIPGSTAVANSFGGCFILIPDYANSTFHKTVLSWSAAKWTNSAGNSAVRTNVFFWRNVAAINSINLHASTDPNLSIGTRATLYGVAG
jgi:hypothetical protein